MSVGLDLYNRPIANIPRPGDVNVPMPAGMQAPPEVQRPAQVPSLIRRLLKQMQLPTPAGGQPPAPDNRPLKSVLIRDQQ